jgi:hypothetical protein
MDIVTHQNVNATWDGKVRCAANLSVRTSAAAMVSVLSGVVQAALENANVLMAGQAMIVARALFHKPCDSALRIVSAMAFALTANAFVFAAIGDQTVATLCAVTCVSLVPSVTLGGAPMIVIPKDFVWLDTANVQRDLKAETVASPSCAGKDATRCVKWTATQRHVSNAKASVPISIVAGKLEYTLR